MHGLSILMKLKISKGEAMLSYGLQTIHFIALEVPFCFMSAAVEIAIRSSNAFLLWSIQQIVSRLYYETVLFTRVQISVKCDMLDAKIFSQKSK